MQDVFHWIRRALPLFSLLTASAQAAPWPAKFSLCYNDELVASNTRELAFGVMARLEARLPSIKFEYNAMPWKRCLKLAETGQLDGVVSGSHSPERAKVLAYPYKPDGSLDASKRMYELGYVLVRKVGSNISYDGQQFVNLNGSLGAQQGYSIVEHLRAQGLTVDDGAKSAQDTLQKLMIGRVAGVLINPLDASDLGMHLAWRGKIERAGKLVMQKPYFLILSQAFAQNHPELAKQLWTLTEQIRQSSDFQSLYGRQMGGLDGAEPPSP
ncbi:transporter substrate-binding domain-containing protein [Chitinivorax sp. B]|uniref:substrate-binding periplasmic protein n=1 Tax=Chitinivorax sp. B TaxID=2502235 RepID=UPI001484EDBD|nr:transporter substrate-binding domain-containing protein [Chitinivorax sp. B]